MAAEPYHESASTAAVNSAPSADWTDTIDTAKWTKAIYIVPSTNQAFTFHNHPRDADVAVKIGGEYVLFATKTEVPAVGGYDIWYLY